MRYVQSDIFSRVSQLLGINIARLKRHTLIWVALILAFASAACAGMGLSSEISNLSNTSWTLTRLNGEPLINDTRITIEFDSEIFRGSSGCNDYGSPYTATEGTLLTEDLSYTALLCGAPVSIMQQEQAYLNVLEHSLTYQLTENSLTVSDTAGKTVLEFRALNH